MGQAHGWLSASCNDGALTTSRLTGLLAEMRQQLQRSYEKLTSNGLGPAMEALEGCPFPKGKLKSVKENLERPLALLK